MKFNKPKVQCPECGGWHEDIKNKYCDGCVMLFAHLQGWDKEQPSNTYFNVCDTCELNPRRHGSKYCQECADEFKLVNGN